jgi:hypothetical protein
MTTLKQLEKEVQRKLKERELQTMDHEKNRAQSVTVGNAGGGVTEISMRGVCGGYLWNVYQPAEVVELINQLAANIGCHIHIQPRNDFSSWREWKEISEEEKSWLNGWPPFAQISDEGYRAATGLPILQKQRNMSGVETKLEHKEEANVATKKAVNKRSTKRSRTPTK